MQANKSGITKMMISQFVRRHTNRTHTLRVRRIRGCDNGGGYEEFCLLGYKAVQSVESKPEFRRNISSPSKDNPSKEPA
jgi:hypothetical protein